MPQTEANKNSSTGNANPWFTGSTFTPSATTTTTRHLFYAVFPALIAGITITVNILNLIILRHNKIVKESTRILLLSVSVADLTIGIMVVFYIYPGYIVAWPFGYQVCQILAFFMFLNLYVSVWTLLFLSLDRYFAISQPLRYQAIVSARRCYIIVTLNWFCAAVVASSPFLGFGEYLFNPSERICGTSSLVSPIPTIVLSTLYVIPALLLSYVTSFLMMKEVRRRVNINNTNIMLTNQQCHLERINTKACVTIGFIVVAFSVTCLPSITGNLIQAFTSKPIPEAVEYTIWWMAISNSYLNFFIYCFTNRSYRRHLTWFLTCQCRGWRRRTSRESFQVLQRKLAAHRAEINNGPREH